VGVKLHESAKCLPDSLVLPLVDDSLDLNNYIDFFTSAINVSMYFLPATTFPIEYDADVLRPSFLHKVLG
jgi:hypothetical protein